MAKKRSRRSAGRASNVKAGKVRRRLATRRTGGRPAHNEAVQTMRQAQRRALVLEMFTDRRLTYSQIVAELAGRHGIQTTAKTVCLDLQAALERTDERIRVSADRMREVEVARTEQADRAVLPLLYDASKELRLKTHDRLLASIERRAKLMGTDKGRDPAGYTVEQVQNLVNGFVRALLDAFADPDSRRKLLDVLKRMGQAVPAIEGEVVKKGEDDE